jgi:hypothetical protein
MKLATSSLLLALLGLGAASAFVVPATGRSAGLTRMEVRLLLGGGVCAPPGLYSIDSIKKH